MVESIALYITSFFPQTIMKSISTVVINTFYYSVSSDVVFDESRGWDWNKKEQVSLEKTYENVDDESETAPSETLIVVENHDLVDG